VTCDLRQRFYFAAVHRDVQLKRTTLFVSTDGPTLHMSANNSVYDTWIRPSYGHGEEERPTKTYQDDEDVASMNTEHHTDLRSSSILYYSDDRRMLVTGMLIAIMIILSVLLCYLVMPLFYDYLRAKIPVSEARKERRYQTIEGWLVSKVRQ
jgi:hypothetical protein